jgi:hypothetical protein
MANMMSSAAPAGLPNVPAPLSTEYKEEVLVNMIKKIGFVAACIDLYDWRNVIDEVLREVEAEHAEPEGSCARRTLPDAA